MTAELVRSSPTASSLELAPAALQLAETIAATDFVPRALRGNPPAVLAAILTGHELGLGPMASLAKIHVIDGRPALAAELMRALVLAAGHELWVAESNNTKCTIGACRSGSNREQTFTWTLDDAKRARLDGKQNWRLYPRAMLIARATGEAVRAVYPDVVAGISYTLEELTDGDIIDIEDRTPELAETTPAPKTKRKAARASTATTSTPAPPDEPEEPAMRGVPALPGEAGYDLLGVPSSISGLSGPPGVSQRPQPDSPDTIDVASTVLPAGAPTSRGESRAGVLDSPPPSDTDGPRLGAAEQIAIRATDAGLDDNGRHDFIDAFTGGRTRSGKDIRPDEIADLMAALVRYKRGELRLERPEGVTPTLVPVEDTADVAYVGTGEGRDLHAWDDTQWQAVIQTAGLRQPAVLRFARRAAADAGIDAPGTLGEITSPHLAAVVRDWIATNAKEETE